MNDGNIISFPAGGRKRAGQVKPGPAANNRPSQELEEISAKLDAKEILKVTAICVMKDGTIQTREVWSIPPLWQ